MGYQSQLWAIMLSSARCSSFWCIRSRKHKSSFISCASLGLLPSIAMFAIFRRTTKDGNVAWIKTGYPEILGLLAFTYFCVCLLYVPTRRWRWAPLDMVRPAHCILRSLHCKVDYLPVAHVHLPWPFGNGSLASHRDGGRCDLERLRRSAQRTLAFVLRQSKVCTAVWGRSVNHRPAADSARNLEDSRDSDMVSLQCGQLRFDLHAALLDLRREASRRAGPDSHALQAGRIRCLTYLLAGPLVLRHRRTGYYVVSDHFAWGMPGVIRSILFTLRWLRIAAFLTRWKCACNSSVVFPWPFFYVHSILRLSLSFRLTGAVGAGVAGSFFGFAAIAVQQLSYSSASMQTADASPGDRCGQARRGYADRS